MHNRSRSPPPPSGGRYRRRSPPPPPQRSPDLLLRRQDDNPPLPIVHDQRSRAQILLEAGRLAAHYLVSQGVIPEHLLRARENLDHKNPTNRPEHVFHARENPEHKNPANRPGLPATNYARKRDAMYHDDDTRWRRNEGGRDWGRDKRDDDRLSRRSGWDMRSRSFDGRHKYNDVGSGGDDDRFGRRSHAYDDQRRLAMSRSYSHNDRPVTSDDRRTSADARLDRKRRSRSRSRTRTGARNYHGGNRRDSDWPPDNGDLDRSKVSESRNIPGGSCHVDYNDADHNTRDLKAPCPPVVMEGDDSASHEDAVIKSKDQCQDVCGNEDGETADDGLIDGDADEINASQHQLSNVDIVHPSEPVEEPAHMQPHLSDVEGSRDSDIARLIDPAVEYNSCSEDLRDELEATQSEIETDVGDHTRDEQELPAWYGIFDLNVAETHDSSEMSESPTNPPANSVCDYVPDLVGLTGQETYYDTSETQGQDECADDNQKLKDVWGLLNQGIGTYDLNKNTMNDEQILLNQGVDEHGQDSHQLEDEQILLNNEERLLKQDTDAHEDRNHQMENEHKLLKQDSAVQALDYYHVAGEQLLFGHAIDEHSDDNHQIKNEQMLPHQASMNDLDNYDLNSEHVLLDNGADKPDTNESRSKDAEMLLEHAADSQPHSLGIGRMIPLVNLEDDYKEQSDNKELLEHKSDALHRDNALPEHKHSYDQQASSFPDHPQTNITTTSSLVTPNFGNRWTGRDTVNAQGIRGDDDMMYGTFDKIPSEVINVWDVPSSEPGKSL